MGINLLTVLLALSVIFGIKAVWTSTLQISARKQVAGPLARKLGWWMISMPLITATSVAVCIGALKLMAFSDELAYGQGIIFGFVFVLLTAAYVANAVRKYGVPIKAGNAPLDWSNVVVQPATADFKFLQNREIQSSAERIATEPSDARETSAQSVLKSESTPRSP